MIVRLILASALVFAFACNKKEEAAADKPADSKPADKPADTKSADTKPADEPADEPAGDILTLKAFTLTINDSRTKDGKKIDNTMILSMDDKGQVSAEGGVQKRPKEVVGSVSVDGKLTDKDGKSIATMNAAGEVTSQGRTPKGKIVVAEDGTVKVGDKTVLTYAEDGTVTLAGKSEPTKYEGAPEGRRAAAMAIIALMMTGRASEETSAGKAEPVEVKPIKK